MLIELLLLISISGEVSICVSFILLMHLVNGAQFLNITPLLLSSARRAAASFPTSVNVIVSLTSTYASA